MVFIYPLLLILIQTFPMKEFFIFFIEAFLFSTLTVTLADLLWDWFVKRPFNDKVRKFTKRRSYAIWCIFVILKFTIFWFNEGPPKHRQIPATFPYVVEESRTGIRLLDKSENDVLSCNISQFAINAGKFYYTCAEKENEVRMFDFDSKSIRTANSGPVLQNFSPQYYWYHFFRIDVTGIILFAGLQLWIMITLQKSRSKV